MNPIKEILSGEESNIVGGKFRGEPAYNKGYMIFFTPRSGSTYLGGLLKNTKSLGIPREWYNIDNIKKISSKNGINDINNYIKFVELHWQTDNRVFGCQATYFQIKYLTELLPFEQVFENINNYFYLYRDNFVLQAISLYRAVLTKYFHNVNNKLTGKGFNDLNVEYDSDHIKNMINRIINNEIGIFDLVKSKKLKIYKLTYESLVNSSEIVVNGIANIVNEELSNKDYLIENKYSKMPVGNSIILYQRFIKEEKSFIRDCINKRKENLGYSSIFNLDFSNK